MKEALKLALEALEDRPSLMKWQKARDAVREALAKQEQVEPVAYLNPDDVCADTAFRWCKIDEFTQPVYTKPQQRTWVGLTDEEMQDLWDRYAHMEMMRAIEAKLRSKNENRMG